MQKMAAQLFFMAPMECKEVRRVEDVPTGKDWQYEIKFDGYRCIAIKQLNEVQLYSRRGMVFKKFLNPGTHGIDQLVVGRYAGKKFMYVAALDDGFIPSTRRKVFDVIKRYAISECPFQNLPEKGGAHRMDRDKMQSVIWVKPRVVVEIAMNEWTPDNHLRHAEYVRLRADKGVRLLEH